MHRLPTTHRTYGRTYVSSRSTRDLDLWAQVEAEERLRQQQEREEQERIAKEEEERRRRKKERKREKREKEEREEREREREERELQEGQIVENDGDDAEEGVEGVTEEMSKLEIDGGEDVDEVERQIMAEIARGQLEKVMMEETDGGNILEEEVVLPIVDTPLTSPEKEEGEDHEKTEETAGMIEATPAPTQALEPQTPPRKQLRRESVVPTTPLTLREVDVSVVVQGAESPHVELHAQSSEEDERETDEETVIRSRLLSPEPLKEVLLTPERRGGLRRRSSRITLTGDRGGHRVPCRLRWGEGRQMGGRRWKRRRSTRK
ncbi:hypothetical protein BDZ91DRAFT_159300 [Kalaharituber pfeilii]|nr:hypothetical protein BDZ91DRAFT_159300 [Kalaharituber pfeilii]